MFSQGGSQRPQRPGTAFSRPSTARPPTRMSNTTVYREGEYGGNFVIAVIEGRGVAREVGIAALDRDTGRTVLLQVADCQTYVKTLHHISLHQPTTLLVLDTALSDRTTGRYGTGGGGPSLLVQALQDEFPGAAIEPVARKYWNENAGRDFIKQLIVEDEECPATLVAVHEKYFALSAACALFKYMESRRNAIFAIHSLRIQYIPVEGTMLIDADSARNLELINNLTHKKSNHSLFGILNDCFTPMAARILRANILAPVTNLNAINQRLDAVQELTDMEDRFTSIKESLRGLKGVDLDKLITALIVSEARPTTNVKIAEQRVGQMLTLRTAVRALKAVREALGGCRSDLLKAVERLINDDRIDQLDSLIAEALNEDAGIAKNGVHNKNMKVYAVKANYNRLLDVARETYKEDITEVYALHQRISEEHDMPLDLQWTENGFHFTVKKDEAPNGRLPKGFVDVNAKGPKWMCSTMELKKWNARVKDALNETMLISDQIIQDVLAEVIEYVAVLWKASEAIALLDMLWAFANASIIRPEFTSTLAIKAGRHPILEVVQPPGMLVANDVYCSDGTSFQLVQGPNMSGKSTYIRQVALLVIMAMIGCFIPAEYASFRLHDALLTRLSNDDDAERNLSTFAQEMATSAMILGMATENSLILVDELGRGTSPHEGIGICHALAEEMIQSKAFVFFTTHFNDLGATLGKHPTVTSLHLEVNTTRQTTSTGFNMVFQHKIRDGPMEEQNHYGLELAKLADLPDGLLATSARMAEHLAERERVRRAKSEGGKINTRRKLLIKVNTL
ncbi:hypothetical protein DACRYDRAFT_89247 [Dacryopinax primogenitus]|uniref:DNA mismatch repair protein MSH3 n=1 Tax=Dacryopinax primogenitus (strain DJM 731) TaxID=1858805 RepID=M5FUS9_DACPD|nr:uncharacterized protein DACRYDRAFT_89247 [Dacryopinax primogenitus]EJU01521.1 hypothetical protein DACRYDRAFT_89247 [Dacryopinax primogenitus]